MCGKCGSIEETLNVFSHQMKEKTIGLWNFIEIDKLYVKILELHID